MDPATTFPAKSPLGHVPVAPCSPGRFRDLLGDDYAEVEDAIARAAELLAGRTVWHVNSTARGGGVAEMLRSLLAYARGAGADVRWITIEGSPEFFRVTKRIHNHLHGSAGDGGELGEAEREAYERTLSVSGRELSALVRVGDIVYLHDPQTAGMVEAMRAAGAQVVWRCHVGLDHPNDLARRAWEFLRGYVESADALVFSREAFAWEGLDQRKLWLVPPSIDAFSPKNQDLEADAVRAILGVVGLQTESSGLPLYRRQDGSPSRVDRRAELDQDELIPSGATLIVQVSRWDRLKDPIGVLQAFAGHLMSDDARLLLAGPAVAGVADDPEGGEMLDEVRKARAALTPEQRRRVHLACLPMEDVEENAAIVNAIQRRADVVVQKSLAEGFGLTVAEAMWKERPVVASRIGGIQDQIVNGESGLLIDDPHDLAATAAGIDSLLGDPKRASAIGAAARERVRERYLGSRHLVQYVNLLEKMLVGSTEPEQAVG